MVDALVTIVVEGILKKAFPIIASEVVLAWGYEKKLTTLLETLDMIRAKLSDAEREKCKRDVVTLWLKKLKDVIEEADDILDEVQYEILRREVKARDQMSRKVPSLLSLKRFSFRREMGHKIEDLNKKLFEINKQAKDLGLHDEQTCLVPNCLHQESDSFLDEFNIVGREKDALHIIELLTKSRKEEKLTILPIVGMGGIGKTILAKLVYNNQNIEKDFDVRAWLCVSVTVDVNTLLAKIYESLGGEVCKVQTRENLIRNLQKELRAKRYLLVLDDVWDEKKEYWDDFRSCMLKVNSHTGSSILVTTRKLEIGTNEMTKDSYALKGLLDDQCWSIFEERAFVAGQPRMPELVEIGHDIVKKCGGLPLVVRVIGGMLRCHNEKEKWLSIKDNKVWDLEDGERVRSTLKLSFDNLPNSIVKQCFAYCSIFKKDTIMERQQIIQLWMALGLLQADEVRNKDMEDVGNDIFHTLVSNSLLQEVKMDEYGYIANCKMHDLVHDLSLSISKHEFLSITCPTSAHVCISQVKHLAMYRDCNVNLETIISFRKMISNILKEDMTTRTLQSLFFNGEVEENISLQSFKCLRILNFAGCRLKKVDDTIGDLVHARYLDLSYTKISVLPKSIGKLYHLQTLKLRGCYLLKDIPEDVRNLISLRHFEFDTRRLSPKVGQLIYLQTLSSFCVGQEKGCKIEELGHMIHLRGKLQIYNLAEITSKEDSIKANLSEKKNLVEIVLCWANNKSVNQNDKDVLEGLQPHVNIQNLKINMFSGDNFPAWVTNMAVNVKGKWTPLDKLVNITLSRCYNCHHLPMLGNLPLLQNLELKYMESLTSLGNSFGQDDDVTGSGKPLSPSLRSLKLEGMKNLEKWRDGAMNSSTMISPVLKTLYIRNCPKIILLDEYHSHPLISLVICSCVNLESIRSIQGLTSLESLRISSCPSLLKIPDLHNQCRSLKDLRVNHCNKLTCLPDGFDCLASVSDVSLGPFSIQLHSFPSLQGIEKLKNLRTLQLHGYVHWESIPEEIKLLASLTSLTITGFGMRELPIWLANMSSIRVLDFYDCPRLNCNSVVPR